MTEQGFPQLNFRLVDSAGNITRPWLYLLKTLWGRTGGSSGGAGAQSGDLKFSATTTGQDGWLLCNGQAVSRLNYAGLFGAIGTTFGVGDGSTTFNVPDFYDRMPLGAGGAVNVGDTGGAATVTLTTTELPTHAHGVTDGGHSHGVTDAGHAHGILLGTAGTGNAMNITASNKTPDSPQPSPSQGDTGTATTGITVDSTTTGITVDSTGSGGAFSVLNPYIGVYVFIKT